MFTAQRGKPLDPSSFRDRVLGGLAEELELPKLTFQVIRRTMATLGKNKGHVKDIQGMMRHTKVATTTDVYMQSLEPEVRSTINSIYEELVGNGTTGPVPHGPNGSPGPSAGWTQNAVLGPSKAAETVPVGGVVLEFATQTQQPQRREAMLNV